MNYVTIIKDLVRKAMNLAKIAEARIPSEFETIAMNLMECAEAIEHGTNSRQSICRNMRNLYNCTYLIDNWLTFVITQGQLDQPAVDDFFKDYKRIMTEMERTDTSSPQVSPIITEPAFNKSADTTSEVEGIPLVRSDEIIPINTPKKHQKNKWLEYIDKFVFRQFGWSYACAGIIFVWGGLGYFFDLWWPSRGIISLFSGLIIGGIFVSGHYQGFLLYRKGGDKKLPGIALISVLWSMVSLFALSGIYFLIQDFYIKPSLPVISGGKIRYKDNVNKNPEYGRINPATVVKDQTSTASSLHKAAKSPESIKKAKQEEIKKLLGQARALLNKGHPDLAIKILLNLDLKHNRHSDTVEMGREVVGSYIASSRQAMENSNWEGAETYLNKAKKVAAIYRFDIELITTQQARLSKLRFLDNPKLFIDRKVYISLKDGSAKEGLLIAANLKNLTLKINRYMAEGRVSFKIQIPIPEIEKIITCEK
ncbi:MAG: hypothetical protein J7L16_07740 [Deltaproteobacteria bacterium]|nr:hypothetical protein [Deltaproteobacteria bacterium]